MIYLVMLEIIFVVLDFFYRKLSYFVCVTFKPTFR